MSNSDDSLRQPLEEVAGLRSRCKDDLINNRNNLGDKPLLKGLLAIYLSATSINCATFIYVRCMDNVFAFDHVKLYIF